MTKYYGKKSIKKKNISGKAICQICNNIDYLEQHHINGHDIPNADSKFNIIDICACCHKKIHVGDIIVEGHYLSTEGWNVIWHKKGEESITNNDSSPFLFKK